MIRNLDISELERLKGISIGMTHDEKPFLILTYDDKKKSDKGFSWFFCSVIVAVLGFWGLVVWWLVQ